MIAYLITNYGPLKKNIEYKVQETGRDYVKINSVHVPKELVTYNQDSNKKDYELPDYSQFV